jgi:uncharacterized membrane protein
MELTPEERRKIYEEEKARLEAREQLERDKRKISPENTTGLAPNVAGLLCYLGAWITGIIFLVIEQKNKWVRFHATQSIIVFGTLLIASLILGWIPFVGPAFSAIIGITGFILWIVLMVKAYSGERYKLPLAGDIADSIVAASGGTADYQKPPETPERPEAPEKPEATEKPEPSSGLKDLDEKIERKVEDFFERRRAGRITASAFAIAWDIALLVFFNFFHQYVAYYHADTFGGIVTWERYPFFTDDIHLWLPILTATLIISIIGHIIFIAYDRYALRQVIHIIIAAFSLATVVTLLSVFPFDFNAIPNTAGAAGTQIGVTVVLIFIAIGISISIVVRIVKLIVNLLKGTAGYRKAA